MTKTDYIFAIIISSIILTLISINIYRYNDQKEIDKTIEELMIQKGKYERCLDSTAQYVFNKYNEYLPDTYWENDIYTSIYEGAEDVECWK